jgi:hypothetical protein
MSLVALRQERANTAELLYIKMKNLIWKLPKIVFLLAGILAACNTDESLAGTKPLPVAEVSTQVPSTVTTIAFPTSRVLPTSLSTNVPPTGIPPQPKYGITVRSSVPEAIASKAMDITSLHDDRYAWTTGDDDSRRVAVIAIGDGPLLAEWVFAVTAPFATVTDRTTMDEVMMGWRTGSSPVGALVVDRSTSAAFTSIWDSPSPAVLIVEDAILLDSLWANRPSWTLIPFDELVPALKVLQVDGQSPIDRHFDPETYPITVPIGISGDESAVSSFLGIWDGPASNRDPDRITRVAMSGVTALGRATAYQMEIRGVTAPGEVVGPVLRDADIAHISHEVSFSAECPYPNPIGDPIFCASDKYMELLTSIGTDVVELTGNHVNDWGPENTARSVDLYEEAGMQTFGGGRNLTDARQPALFEHNGNKIALVGCNPVGPPNAWATDHNAGSLPCDFDAYYNQIRELRDSGYAVIATLQYAEFYHYAPTNQQRLDFRAIVDAGATAVSGSQGHHAQGFDLYENSFIHYGLGNLFFDQMDMLGTRQSFIDIYVFYNGELISVDLYTSLIENYCCPRAMRDEERAQLLESVFQASGW